MADHDDAPDKIRCLECGKEFSFLAPHWGSTPEPPKFPLRHFSPPASASKGLFGERK